MQLITITAELALLDIVLSASNLRRTQEQIECCDIACDDFDIVPFWDAATAPVREHFIQRLVTTVAPDLSDATREYLTKFAYSNIEARAIARSIQRDHVIAKLKRHLTPAELAIAKIDISKL
jgi:hypothetical protein